MPFVTVPIAYLYAEDDYWQKYMTVCEEIGWPKSSLISHWLNSYCSVNKLWLQEAAELDAIARGYAGSKGEYFKVCRDWKEIRPYSGARPVFANNPLATIPKVSISKTTRRSYHSIRASAVNAAFFRLVCEIEADNKQNVLSRIAVWYVTKFWERSYQWQLNANEQLAFSPDIGPEL